MKILNWIAYACWALAAIMLFFSFQDARAFSFLFGLAGSLAVSGVLFFAFSKVIFLLTDIRDALTNGSSSISEPEARNTEAQEYTAPKAPTRSLEELSSDIEQMKKNL